MQADQEEYVSSLKVHGLNRLTTEEMISKGLSY